MRATTKEAVILRIFFTGESFLVVTVNHPVCIFMLMKKLHIFTALVPLLIVLTYRLMPDAEQTSEVR